MISVAEALTLVERHTPPRRTQRVPLHKAHGRVLAEDVYAAAPSPRFTNSAMDGFAVRSEDCGNDTVLPIVGKSAAGKPFEGRLPRGAAIGISTGAVLPDGADAVVPVEDAELLIVEGSDAVCPLARVKQGQYVRRQGSEYAQGDALLRSGTLLNAARVALLAQNGNEEVAVVALPRVAVVVTGEEIVQDASVLREGAIMDANSPMLAAALAESGAECVFVRRVGDTLEETVQVLREAMQIADIVLTTGGASVGEHDALKPAAQTLGFETIFWRVRQKPGKPLLFAKRADTVLFGLPGNPVSVLMCYKHYVHPMITTLRGLHPTDQRVIGVVSQELVDMTARRELRAEFVRVRLDYASNAHAAHTASLLGSATLPSIIPIEKQESFMLTSLTNADGFVFLEVSTHIQSGMMIEVVLL
jgi:molybdopterin molybdotransferase